MSSTSRNAVLSTLLLLIASLVLLSSAPFTSAQSVMNFCYYMQQDAATPAWNISVSGSMTVTGPVTTSGQAVYTVVGITGVRTQSGTGASTVYITGLAPNTGSPAPYSNTLNTLWPFLTGGTATGGGGSPQTAGGIGYTVSAPVTVPAPGATATTTINIVSHPINELPLYSVNSANAASGLTGLSYFVYQPASSGVPNCNPNSAVTYSFYYTVSPTYNATGANYAAIGDWSACVTAKLQVVGPFYVPASSGSGLDPVVVVVGATGSRTIAATGTLPGSATATLSGVGPDDGGDFMFYGYGPPVSNAGITFRYTSAPTVITQQGVQGSSVNTYNYLNIYTTNNNNYVINEANVAVQVVDQAVALTYPQPTGTNSLVDSYVCPANTVLTQAFSFCYYGEGIGGPSVWYVAMSGTLLTAPEITGSGHYFVTAATGTRTQNIAGTITTVNVTGVTGITVDASTSTGSLDNQISASYPFLSNHGIGFVLSSAVSQPAPYGMTAPPSTTNIYLINDPPCELGTCPIVSNQLSYLQGWSVFLLYPSRFGGAMCGPPGQPGGLPTTSLNFGYTATPTTGAVGSGAGQPPYFNTSSAPAGKGCSSTYTANNNQNLACPIWSSCTSATLTAIGPLSLPGATATTNVSYAFAIYNATGARTYYDVTGATEVLPITGIVYQDGADQTLYFGAPYVDNAGISFKTPTAPRLAYPDGETMTNGANGQSPFYINVWSATQNPAYYGYTATESTASAYPDNTATIAWGVTTATTQYGVALPVMSTYVCPAQGLPAYTLLNFCIFISALPGSTLASGSNYAAVAYSGQFIAQPAAGSSSNWIVTGVTGTRSTYTTSPYGNGNAVAQTPSSTQTLSSINSGSPNNANLNPTIGQQYPILSTSGSGLNFVVTNSSGSQQTIVLSGNPPVESTDSAGVADTGFILYTAASDSSLSTCPPTNTQTLSFYYTDKPASSSDDSNQKYNSNPSTGQQWSSCMSGLLQVIGPYTFPAAHGGTSRTAYVVLGATGARTFIDVNGTAWTTWLTGLNNGVAGGSTGDGADMLLYTTAPYVDNAGITFDMSGPPRWPNSADPAVAINLQQYNYVNLWFQGLPSGWNGPTEAIPPYTPYNYASFSYSTYSSGQNLYQCPQGPNLNNIPLTFGTTTSAFNNGGGSSSSSADHTLSNGQVAGIAVGVTLAFIILIALAIFLTLTCCVGARKSNSSYSTDNGKVNNNTSHVQMEESRNAEAETA